MKTQSKPSWKNLNPDNYKLIQTGSVGDQMFEDYAVEGRVLRKTFPTFLKKGKVSETGIKL